MGAGERREDDGVRLNRGWRSAISPGGTLKLRRAARGNDSCSSPDLIHLEARKVGIRLPGKGNSNSHGARPVHQIISIMKTVGCRIGLSLWEGWGSTWAGSVGAGEWREDDRVVH